MTSIPPIDWGRAARVGASLVPPGPAVSESEAGRVVESLRTSAHRAADIIADRSGLVSDLNSAVKVFDRPRWIEANAFRAEELLREIADVSPRPRLASVVLGTQAGAVLSVFSTRILGQFEGLVPEPRLLLVAPNIVAFERKTSVNPTDFRLWACLHEQTHQFQFGHAPWLRGHLIGLTRDFLSDGDAFDPSALAKITAAMSFLEGHAEVQMDRCAAGAIQSVARLRRVLDQHRRVVGPLNMVQKLIGLDDKVSQYQVGAAFCRYLYDRGGLEMLNRPLSEPGALPTAQEIAEPAVWVDRVG